MIELVSGFWAGLPAGYVDAARSAELTSASHLANQQLEDCRANETKAKRSPMKETHSLLCFWSADQLQTPTSSFTSSQPRGSSSRWSCSLSLSRSPGEYLIRKMTGSRCNHQLSLQPRDRCVCSCSIQLSVLLRNKPAEVLLVISYACEISRKNRFLLFLTISVEPFIVSPPKNLHKHVMLKSLF